MLFDIFPLFINDATEEGRKKREEARAKKAAQAGIEEEEVVSRVAARDARRPPACFLPSLPLARSQIGNVVKCVTDA